MNVRNEELLSAYLDGELSGEEQARVEQLLVENGSFRTLHDDLRALRIDVEALPRYSAPEGFAQQVLAEARRQAAESPAAESPAAESPAAVADSERNGQVGLPEQGSISMSGRSRWVWPLIAAAAALLILLFNPSDEDEIARQDAPQDAAQHGETDDRDRTAPSLEAPPFEAPSMEAAPAGDATTAESAPVAPSPARDGLRVEATDEAIEKAKKENAAPATRQHGGQNRLARSPADKHQVAASANGAVEPPGQADAFASQQRERGALREEGVAKQAQVAPSAELRSDGFEGGGFGGGGEFSPQHGPAILAQEDRASPAAPSADFAEDFDLDRQTLVVSLTVTTETARARLVERLLAQEGAEVAEQQEFAAQRRAIGRNSESSGESSELADEARGRQPAAPSGGSATALSGGGATAPQEEPNQRDRRAFTEADPADRPSRATHDEQVLLVRATPRQLEQTILELADHPDKVPGFTIGEAPQGNNALPAAPRSAEAAESSVSRYRTKDADGPDAKLQDQQAAQADQHGPDNLRDVRRREAQRGLTQYFARQESAAGNRAESERKQAFTDGGGRRDSADAKELSAAADGDQGFGGQIAGARTGRATAPSGRGGLNGQQAPAAVGPAAVAGATAHAAPIARVQAMFVIRVMGDPAAADPAATRDQPAGANAAEQP